MDKQLIKVVIKLKWILLLLFIFLMNFIIFHFVKLAISKIGACVCPTSFDEVMKNLKNETTPVYIDNYIIVRLKDGSFIIREGK